MIEDTHLRFDDGSPPELKSDFEEVFEDEWVLGRRGDANTDAGGDADAGAGAHWQHERGDDYGIGAARSTSTGAASGET